VADVLVGAYVAVILGLIALAGYTAVINEDAARREDARKVLWLLVTAGTASSIVGFLVRLHQLGILR
jgi:hypothetical protein